MSNEQKNDLLDLLKEEQGEEDSEVVSEDTSGKNVMLQALFTERKQKKVEQPKVPEPKKDVPVPPHLQEFKKKFKKMLQEALEDLD